MKIPIANARGAGLGLGTSNVEENYMLSAGITNLTNLDSIYVPITITLAIRAFYAGLVAAGLEKSFDVIYLFFGTTANQDKENLVSPTRYPAVSVYQVTFVNDAAGAHTLQGFQCVTSPARYGTFVIPVTSITNMHLTVVNSTAETSGAVTRFIGGVKDIANGNDLNLSLARNNNGLTSGRLSIGSSGTSQIVNSAAGYDVTKTGPLTIFKAGTTHTLVDNSVQIGQKTGVPDPIIVIPNLTFSIGSITGTPASTSACKISGFMFGQTLLTLAQVQTVHGLWNTLKAALGA